jgi:hypothetical protein
MDHAVPRLSLQIYPQPERRAPDLVACTVPGLLISAYLAYNVPWPTYILCVKSSQVNDM